jgi:hypothetical protein
LGAAIRAFEKGELFMRHMAQYLGHENTESAESFLTRADEAKRRATLMRQAANGVGCRLHEACQTRSALDPEWQLRTATDPYKSLSVHLVILRHT